MRLQHDLQKGRKVLDLSDTVRVLRRQWLLIVISTLIGLLSAAGMSLLSEPQYTARTQLFTSIQSTGSVTELQQGNSFTQARVQSYAEAATTPAVLQPVIDRLGLQETATELKSQIHASADLDTVIISITATNTSPVRAAAIADAVAESLISTVEDLEKPSGAQASPVKLSSITPATAPVSPSTPNTKLNGLLGAFGGLLLGLVACILRSRLDTRIRGEADFKNLSSVPVLGGVVYDPDAQKKRLLTQVSSQSPRAESFRQIRTNLRFSNVTTQTKTMLISSSLPSEGKTTSSINIAIATAQAGQRVVLVDADLRRPRIAEYLGLEGKAGLTTALVGAADVEDLLQPWGEDDLYVLTSGQLPPNPSELLESHAMTELLMRLKGIFDVVIIDAPPLIPVTDASVLGQKVDGVILVVGTGKVKKADLEKSLSSLQMVDARLLGVVMNMLPVKGPDAYEYSYYSYETDVPSAAFNSSRASKKLNGSHMKTSRKSRGRSISFKNVTDIH